jgi:Beta/Gamma crystallin
MSNINNDGVDMNKKTLAELSFTTVKELSNELAATCSGGTATLYEDDNFEARRLTFRRGDSDLTNNNFNDVTNSIIIRGKEKWGFYEDANFKKLVLVLGPGAYRDISRADNIISSLRRLA